MTLYLNDVDRMDAIDTSPRLISCAYGEIYRDGAFPSEQNIQFASPEERSTFGVASHLEIYPPQFYHWYFTGDRVLNGGEIAGEIADFYRLMSDRNAPASMLVQIDGAVIGGGVVYYDPRISYATVYETFRPNDRPAVIHLSHDQLLAADEDRLAQAGPCLFLGSAGSGNYGHWLIDDLPRVKAYRDLQGMLDGDPVTIVMVSNGARMDTVRAEMVRALIDLKTPIIFLDPARAYRVPRLLYVSPVSDHPVMKTPAAIGFVRDRIAASRPVSRRDRRLFIDRDATHGRSIINKDEVERLLRQHGFESINPGLMNFAEQSRLFSEAGVVIGTMGAAMTNSVFCEHGTKLLHLAPNDWHEPFYWDLSVVERHDYHVLFGRSPDFDTPPHLRDFVVPIDHLQSYLTTLGAVPTIS